MQSALGEQTSNHRSHCLFPVRAIENSQRWRRAADLSEAKPEETPAAIAHKHEPASCAREGGQPQALQPKCLLPMHEALVAVLQL